MLPRFDEQQLYRDRRDAGGQLATRLEHLKGKEGVVVLALPRGGVPVGYEVARGLGAPLDVFLVRKLGMPGHLELAMGAIASGGVTVLNHDVLEWYSVPAETIHEAVRREQAELERREATYRERPPIDVAGKVAVLVDDGLATGASMKAAVRAVRARHPSRVVVAVPVGSPETCRDLEAIADEVICGRTPASFSAVGEWYRDFSQTTDDEVRSLLREAASAGHGLNA